MYICQLAKYFASEKNDYLSGIIFQVGLGLKTHGGLRFLTSTNENIRTTSKCNTGIKVLHINRTWLPYVPVIAMPNRNLVHP